MISRVRSLTAVRNGHGAANLTRDTDQREREGEHEHFTIV